MTKSEQHKLKKRLSGSLQKAIELELSTIPPYLMAMYSIKPGKNTIAFDTIKSVALEEMLHMILAANVLSAIGGKILLGEKNIPKYPDTWTFTENTNANGRKKNGTSGPRVRTVMVNLQRLNEDALNLFLEIEKPEDELPMDQEFRARDIQGITVGKFYDSIIEDLQRLAYECGDSTFSGNPKNQITEKYYWGAGGKPIVVTDLESACMAINMIKEQGEGFKDSDKPFADRSKIPHYYRFNELLFKKQYAPGDSRKSIPSGTDVEINDNEIHNTLMNPTHSRYVEMKKPDLIYLNARFNYNYAMMLTQIQEGFAGNPDVFYTAIVNCMRNMTDFASQIVELKFDNYYNGAPSFEWPNVRLSKKAFAAK